MIARSTFFGGSSLRRPCPGSAERAGVLLVFLAAREGVNLAAPVPRDLNAQVRARAEAVQPQPLAMLQIRQADRAVADDPRAEHRRDFHVAEAFRDGDGVVFVRGDVLGIAAVGGVAREQRRVAQVFLPVLAVDAGLVGPVQPGDADAVARLEARRARAERVDHADDLVSGDDRQLRIGKLTLNDVQIGMADAARAHAHQNLVIAGRRTLDFAQMQRIVLHRIRSIQNLRFHSQLLTLDDETIITLGVKQFLNLAIARRSGKIRE